MFIRTRRLFLRPAWPEDAGAIAAAIGYWDIVRHLSRAPWPYGLAEAQYHVARAVDPAGAHVLMFARTESQPVLVGGISFGRWPESGRDPELGYWVRCDRQGRGYATEAGQAVLEIAFEGLRLPRLAARHFIDNPASGRVLEKLGFTPTGEIRPRHCRARGHEVDSVEYALTREAWQAQHACPNLGHLLAKPPIQADAIMA